MDFSLQPTPPDESPLVHYANTRNTNSAKKQQRSSLRRRRLNDDWWNLQSNVAANTAVNHWEDGYIALKSLLRGGRDNLVHIYGAVRRSASEVTFLVWPLWCLTEESAISLTRCVSSPQTHAFIITRAEQLPFIGPTVVVPTLIWTGECWQRTLQLLEYPIPSRQWVRERLTESGNAVGHAVVTTHRHLGLYLRQVDALVTRAMLHARWKVLGSGPYQTLQPNDRRVVTDHLSQRYLQLTNACRRYELVAHVKRSNPFLYQHVRQQWKLVQQEDEWLEEWPVYRHVGEPFEGPGLWFQLPNVNGETPAPSRHLKWNYLDNADELEERWREIHVEGYSVPLLEDRNAVAQALPPDTKHVAHWYNPLDTDVCLEDDYGAVTMYTVCPSCQEPQRWERPPLAQTEYGQSCVKCRNSNEQTHYWLPPIAAIWRPTLWRFHGPGDEVRRATWVLDTPRHGLQPFEPAAQVILEDAYLFLCWRRQTDDLLTVEVSCPDGPDRLVQFSSPTLATAVQTGALSAVSVFKRRVYRGIQQAPKNIPDDLQQVLLETAVERDDEAEESLAAPRWLLPNHNSKKKKKNEPSKDHLVLVVHGIGEMMRSNQIFGHAVPNLASIVDCCGYLRSEKVEYLPIEWHEAFSVLSQRRQGRPNYNLLLKDISLPTIPNMRDFANDTLMDVLYFMSPEHHNVILQIVAEEMNFVYQRYCELTQFQGRVSVMGHSLGSIVCWDLLAHQPIIQPPSPCSDASSLSSVSLPVVPPPSASMVMTYPQLDFEVDNFFLLGSPVAVFLMIRNQRKPLHRDYVLPGCPRVFNIFHPYDPVAYRLEPCIHARNKEFEPCLIKHWTNGGFRVQYQTKRLWKNLVERTWQTQQDVVEGFETAMTRIGLLEEDLADHDDSSEASESVVVTGLLNQGRRIDYMLQEREIEAANEYVSALAAHSSYWTEKDLSLFVARQIQRAVQEDAGRL